MRLRRSCSAYNHKLTRKLVDAATGKVLGVTVVGRLTTELIAEITLAVQLGATLEDLSHTIHAHPTLSESLHEAVLGAMGKPLHVPMP